MVNYLRILDYVILSIGIALLAFTAINFYLVLQGIISILSISTSGLTNLLPSIIETCIRGTYLVIMGWIGFTLTRKGIKIIKSK